MSFSLLITVLCALAAAHPGVHKASAHPAPEILGQRLDIAVIDRSIETDCREGDSSDCGYYLEVKYTAEVPERRVLSEVAMDAQNGGDQKQYAARRLVELAGGLRVRWQGAALALPSVEVEHAARNGEPGFLEFHVLLYGPLPSLGGKLEVQNGNYPDDQCFYATSVSVPGSYVVTQTSLGHVVDGLLRDSTHGAWTKKDEAREFSMTLRPAGYWEERDGDLPLPERMAGLQTLSAPKWVWAAGSTAIALAGGLAFWRLRARA